jgi:hypothetical protein
MSEILTTIYISSLTMLLIAWAICMVEWSICRRRCLRLSRNIQDLIGGHSLCFECLEKPIFLYHIDLESFEIVIDGTMDWKQAFEVPEKFIFIYGKDLKRLEAAIDKIQDWRLVLIGGGESMINVFWEVGVDLTILDDNGRTILHAAVEENSEPVVLLLWKLGFDMTAKNRKGMTARDVAKEADLKEMLELLWELRVGAGRAREEDES